MKPELIELEDALGHRFAVPERLVRALTHRSLAREQAAREQAAREHAGRVTGAQEQAQGNVVQDDNERLEFLGDAVLGLVVAEALYAAHPEWQEGELTRVRAQLVSRQHMAGVAASMGLGDHLRLSRGEERGGLRQKSTVLSNAMEAVIAALYLDGGMEPVRVFVGSRVMGEAAELLAEEVRTGAALGNYKSALQEHLQATHLGVPVYRIRRESGPDHRKRFLVEVRVRAAAGEPDKLRERPLASREGLLASREKPLARGTGSTKKRAEQDAARRALDGLRGIGGLDAEGVAGGAEPAEPAEPGEESEGQAAP
ncbi:MAG: ribonuclease III [Terracidiphilus sp.]